QRLVELVGCVRLRHTDAGSGPRWLHEGRVPETFDVAAHRFRILAPPRLTHRHAGRDRDTRVLQRNLRKVLVETERRIEHAPADVGELERVEETLNRAVLPMKTVKDREHDVDLAEGVDGSVVPLDAQLARAARHGPEDPRAVVDDL